MFRVFIVSILLILWTRTAQKTHASPVFNALIKKDMPGCVWRGYTEEVTTMTPARTTTATEDPFDGYDDYDGYDMNLEENENLANTKTSNKKEEQKKKRAERKKRLQNKKQRKLNKKQRKQNKKTRDRDN